MRVRVSAWFICRRKAAQVPGMWSRVHGPEESQPSPPDPPQPVPIPVQTMREEVPTLQHTEKTRAQTTQWEKQYRNNRGFYRTQNRKRKWRRKDKYTLDNKCGVWCDRYISVSDSVSVWVWVAKCSSSLANELEHASLITWSHVTGTSANVYKQTMF